MAIISTDKQYKITLKKIKESKAQEDLFVSELDPDISNKDKKLLLAPITCFREQMEYEIKEYEEIKKGNIPEYMLKMENLGLLLVALRIKNGWTQTKLAQKLGKKQSQISRDERNEYYGVSLPTIKKILKVYDQDILFNLTNK